MTREDRERRQMEVIAGIPDGVLSHPPGCAPDPWDGLVRWWHVRIEEVEPLFPAYDHDSEFRVTYINATYDEPDLAPRLVGWERVASTMAFPDEVECPDCDEGEPCKTCEGTHFIYDPGNIAILWRKVAELETWEMGEAHGMRRFTVAAAPVWAGGCRSSPTSNYGKLVWPNDFIVYGDGRGAFGRVLGRIIDCPKQEGDDRHEGSLLVLELAPDGRWAYGRWIFPSEVKEAGEVPEDFLRWFLQPELPDPNVTLTLSRYGTLTNDNIADPTKGPTALFGQCRRFIPGEHLPPTKEIVMKTRLERLALLETDAGADTRAFLGALRRIATHVEVALDGDPDQDINGTDLISEVSEALRAVGLWPDRKD